MRITINGTTVEIPDQPPQYQYQPQYLPPQPPRDNDPTGLIAVALCVIIVVSMLCLWGRGCEGEYRYRDHHPRHAALINSPIERTRLESVPVPSYRVIQPSRLLPPVIVPTLTVEEVRHVRSR